MPVRSARYWTCPDLAFLTASATSWVTVPLFGFGIKPRGPNILPSEPTTRMQSGAAMTTSKSKLPALTCSARSSSPTTSAPASFAASALAPCAKTATRISLPVPWGNTIAPLTFWSACRGSIPRFTERSTDSLNFPVGNSVRILIASSIA